MTLAEATKTVRALGLSLRKVDGEYQVRTGRTEETYFTDNIEDAVDTAKWIANAKGAVNA